MLSSHLAPPPSSLSASSSSRASSLIRPIGVIYEPFNVKNLSFRSPLLDPIVCQNCSAKVADVCELKPGEWQCLFCSEWNPLGTAVSNDAINICDVVVAQGADSSCSSTKKAR